MTVHYRLYSFVNALYLKEIQLGIQTAHVVSELYSKYYFGSDSNKFPSILLDIWGKQDKTIIVLNGGNVKGLKKINDFLVEEDKKGFFLPYATFSEDDESLGGILTSVGVIVPEDIYDSIDYKTAQKVIPNFEKYESYTGQLEGSWFYLRKDDEVPYIYLPETPIGKFLTILKQCKLAR